MYQYDVFFSYSGKNKALATEITQALKEKGLKVWYASEHFPSEGGRISEIEEKISQSKHGVFLVSTDWLESKWCQLEAGTFINRYTAQKLTCIFPIYYDIEPKFVQQFRPILGDFYGKKLPQNYTQVELENLVSVLVQMTQNQEESIFVEETSQIKPVKSNKQIKLLFRIFVLSAIITGSAILGIEYLTHKQSIQKIDNQLIVTGLPFCTEEIISQNALFGRQDMAYIYSKLEDLDLLNVIPQRTIQEKIKTYCTNNFCEDCGSLELAQELKADYLIMGEYGIRDSTIGVTCQFQRVEDGQNMDVTFHTEGKISAIKKLHKALAIKILKAFRIILSKEKRLLLDSYTINATSNSKAYQRLINAEYYLLQNEPQKAEQESQAGIKIDPKSPNLYLVRGQAQIQQGKKEEAQQSFKKVTQLSENQPEIVQKSFKYRIGKIYQQGSKDSESIFSQSSKKQPKDNFSEDTEGDNSREFHENLRAVQKGKKWGFVNTQNTLIIPFKYDQVGRFSEGLVAVKQDGKWGFINKQNQFVFEPQFKNAGRFSEGLVNIKKGKYWYFMDRNGKFLPFVCQDASSFQNGLAPVKRNEKWGFINPKGAEAIPIKYDYVGTFSEGLINVNQNHKWGFLDTKGKVIIPLKYENAGAFANGKVTVKLNGKWFYINKKGECVQNCP